MNIFNPEPKHLFEALEALCKMWEQYCSGPTGHMFMSAGEDTAEILEKYQLLENRYRN